MKLTALISTLAMGGLALLGSLGNSSSKPSRNVATHEAPPPVQLIPDVPNDPHPLQPLLEEAEKCLKRIKADVRDYTCIWRRRESIGGVLGPTEFALAKVRHEQVVNDQVVTPRSVHLEFKKPATVRDRQVLYVRGWKDDKCLFRKGGTSLAFITGALMPDDPLIMRDNRYPVTDFGIEFLVQRMIDVGKREMEFGECEVAIDEDFLLGKTSCTRIEVTHPIRRSHFLYHISRIYIDNEMELPVRFEAYDWPEKPGDQPSLLEDYAYCNLKLNVDLTDDDFQNSQLGKMFQNSEKK